MGGSTPASRSPDPPARDLINRGAAARRLVVAVGFVSALAGIGVAAAVTAWRSPINPFFEACCMLPVATLVVLEL